MTEKVTQGSCWLDSQGRRYHVISVSKIQEHNWVFYKLETNTKNNENTEFSCYEESFLERFTAYANYQ